MAKNITTEVSTVTCKCQRCKDIKYVFFDEFVEGYGYHEWAQPCPACNPSSIANDQRCRAGIPQKYFCTFYPEFKWDSYNEDITVNKQLTSDFIKAFQEWKDNRLGLYIWSRERGSGKTMLASSILNSLMVKEGISARFTSVPYYMDILQKAFKKKSEETDHSRQFWGCDVLCLDDLGAEKQSDWSNQELFKLIDYRYTKGKIIIATSNMSIKDLECDSRIIDRLNDMCMQIHMPEEGIRAQKANLKKQKFVDSIRRKYQ